MSSELSDSKPACHSRTIAVSREGKVARLTFHRRGGVQFCHLETQDLANVKEVNQTAFEAKADIAVFALAPNGRKGVSASGRKQDLLVFWDLEKGSIQAGKGIVTKVMCLAFSANGKRVISGSADKSFTLWNVSTRKAIKRYRGNTGMVNCVAFSPDGKRALTGSSDKTVRLWDLKSGKQLSKFTGHQGPVTSVAFSADGLLALSGGTDKTVKLWRLPKVSR
jgi:WD40 repeat protein